MLQSFYRQTFVFENRDVALKFVAHSLVGKRLPISTIKTANELTYISYEGWEKMSEDEKQDSIFFPGIKRKELDRLIIKHQ